MKKIIVLGSLNMDLVMKASSIPNQGETIEGEDFFITPGGKGANQAVCCGKQGADVTMIGCVGTDHYGEKLINNLKESGVNTQYIKKTNKSSTGVAVILISNHDNRIIVNSGANSYVSKEDVKKAIDDMGQSGNIFITQMEIPFEIVKYGLKYAKEKGMKTILNPSPIKQSIKNLLPYVDIIVANESETKVITGVDVCNIQKAFEIYKTMGVNEIVITLGKKGSINQTLEKVEAHHVDVMDTTAAGDTYLGALSCALNNGKSLVESMKWASLASAIAVTRLGAQKSIPTYEEVIAFKEVITS